MELTDQYQPGAFFFAAPDRTLLASDPRHVLSEKDSDALSAQVNEALAEYRGIAVGALPYDDTGETHVLLPASVSWAGPIRPGKHQVSLPGHRVTSEPSPEEYERGVSKALALLNDGTLGKVVLARTLRIDLDEPVDMRRMLASLAAMNTHGYTFATPLPTPGVTLVSASPELLVRRTGMSFVSRPLAGSQPRGKDPVEDRANAQRLLASKKDQDEHRWVVEAEVEALRPFCRRMTVPRTPSLVSTPSMWHLCTTITGELADRSVTALTLAAALHPTPAVCGSPTRAARDAIAQIESFDRGFYTGAVGWVDSNGDGEWAVAIRSADVTDQSLRLYAGAGIVDASVPELELAETSAKFQTLLRGMGLDLTL
ncbi:isochorismate synthase [Kibdelosporangium persicum]|uniref:isochorismate synthase n=1 Tax=Kibdelosporangium persicum TaxID=2698649 RepID=A0ABX2FGT2_9PSEU|nr:isochorismate synthase [Kibdelosporangium persicum]NRN70492.1 Isochorismate synthase of siderophore biosynthesis [Kibdelosporangium persicum]